MSENMGKTCLLKSLFFLEKVEGTRSGPRVKKKFQRTLIFFLQVSAHSVVHTLDQIFQISKMITFVYQMAYYVMQDLRISSNI